MEFKEGATVITADGEDAGRLDRVVLDPRTHEVTHIVVHQGVLFTQDKVVPVELIQQASGDKVVLRSSKDDLEDLPDFEETEFVSYEETNPVGTTTPPTALRQMFWYPPVGAAGWAYPGYGAYPMPYLTRTERNIPANTVPLKEGVRVISADDQHVGNVEEVLTDSATDTVTHFVITKGLLVKERKLIPVSWVDDTEEDAVYLAVDSRIIERLPDYQPTDR